MIYNFHDKMDMAYFNIQPSEVKARANTETEYYKRYLYTKLFANYKFTIPEWWPINYFRHWLFEYGSIAIIYTKEYGWIPHSYSILEQDLFYQPKKIQVGDRFIDTKVGIVGINCGLVKCMDDYFGLDDLVTRYAVQLAEIDKAFHVNIFSTNTSTLFQATDKKQADEIKEAYAAASEGKPFVVVNKDVINPDAVATLLPNPASNFIGDKLLAARATVVKQFLTEIGIKNANTEKKERLISDEVNQNNDETNCVIDIILDNINKCFDDINDISGLGLKVEKRYKEKEVKNEIHTNGLS